MGKIKDIEGVKFGKLLAIGRTGNKISRGIEWLLLCDCGSFKLAPTSQLGKLRSCGCENPCKVIHGLTKSPTYVSWSKMKLRCHNPNTNRYQSHGGRGIKVCEFLNASVENLISVIGLRPEGKSIDRTNNDGHYSCGSCEECLRNGWPANIAWSTNFQQIRNRRNTVLITFQGVTMCAKDWANKIGICHSGLRARFKSGWSLEKALTKCPQ